MEQYNYCMVFPQPAKYPVIPRVFLLLHLNSYHERSKQNNHAKKTDPAFAMTESFTWY